MAEYETLRRPKISFGKTSREQLDSTIKFLEDSTPTLPHGGVVITKHYLLHLLKLGRTACDDAEALAEDACLLQEEIDYQDNDPKPNWEK